MSGLGLISGMGSGLGVVERPQAKTKLEVRCACGKRYRVPVERAGRSFRCKSCSARLRVPRASQPESLSSHDAQRILAELGIDTSARERFEAEVVCFFCASPLGKSEREALDEGEQPLCFACRASAGQPVVDTPEPSKKPENYRELDSWVRPPAVREARQRALRLGALIGIGISGFCSSLMGLGLGPALAVGVLLGAFGGHHTYRATVSG